MAIGADGLALLVVSGSTPLGLTEVHCRDASCSAADTGVLSTGAIFPVTPQLTIGTDGLGLLLYATAWGTGDPELDSVHLSNTLGLPYVHRR